jgi:transposase-like protein
MNADGPQTLIEAVKHFADLGACHAYMVNLKWPDGKIVCPKCGADKIGNIASRSMLQCKAVGCRKQFSAKVGTIFEDSPLPLSSWFVAAWCIANAKNGISSCELARALGVRQPTAWFMLHRIRLAMGGTPTGRSFHDVVESDESYFGGKAANMHFEKRERTITGRGGIGKTIVHGLLQRNADESPSQVDARVIPNAEQVTIMARLLRNVEPGTVVNTDAALAYTNLADRYVHYMIDHSVRYVAGKVHINGIENFWCLVKRMIRGTYVHVAPFHLDRYLDEEVWRFNKRKLNDGSRFNTVMQGVLGKRITYRVLCAIDDAGFMGIV